MNFKETYNNIKKIPSEVIGVIGIISAFGFLTYFLTSRESTPLTREEAKTYHGMTIGPGWSELKLVDKNNDGKVDALEANVQGAQGIELYAIDTSVIKKYPTQARIPIILSEKNIDLATKILENERELAYNLDSSWYAQRPKK